MCQMGFERNSRDFVFAFVNRITVQNTNLSTCPLLPGNYIVRNLVLDSKAIPGFVSFPDKSWVLSASYCRKQNKKKESCFVSGVAKLRYMNN